MPLTHAADATLGWRAARGMPLKRAVLVCLALLLAGAASARRDGKPRHHAERRRLGRGGGDLARPRGGTAGRGLRPPQRHHRQALCRHRQEHSSGAAAVRRRRLLARMSPTASRRLAKTVGQIFRGHSIRRNSFCPGRPATTPTFASRQRIVGSFPTSISPSRSWSKSPAPPSIYELDGPINIEKEEPPPKELDRAISRHPARLERSACALRVRALRRALRAVDPVL